MLQSLFDSQISTLGFVLSLLFVMFLVLFRSVKIAFIAIIANIIPISILFGIMGWLHIPLDIMTITIAAISIGIGVDDTIHYIHRFKEEFKHDHNYENAMVRAHKSIGYAMYYTSVVIMIGFSILVLSNLIPTIYFGLLTVVVMFSLLASALLLLPRLMIILKPYERLKKMKIAIYCGSAFGNDEIYKNEAIEVVKYLKQKDASIVYGGSKSGLMGIISNKALELDMEVYGVITTRLSNLERENKKLHHIIRVDSIRQRKQAMLEASDAFLVMPGGFGTFDEIFEVLTLIQVGELNKPCAFLNINSYYDKLKEFLYSCVEKGFIAQRFVDMLVFEDDISKIYSHFENYKKVKSKWD